jgi:outer membrane protein assembly factor BamD (BamD/ComL family)
LERIAFGGINYLADFGIQTNLEHNNFMKKAFIILSFVVLSFTATAFAQKPAEPPIQRDPILEADAKHNLEVAWQYYKLKKAYKAVLMRAEETFAAHPDFSKMDEFLFIAAMSSMYLSEGKGKQKIDLDKLSSEEQKKYAPDKLRQDAIDYFKILKDKYPNSKYIGETEKNLKLLQGKK